MKRLKKNFGAALIVMLAQLGFGSLSEAIVTVPVLPDDKYSQIGDIRDYNGFIDGEHSADSADTEGPVIITGDSLFPNDTVTFTFGASFRTVNATVGTPLLDSQVVNVLTDGKIKNYSNAVISFESSSDSRGWNIGNPTIETWLEGSLTSQMVPRYLLDQARMDLAVNHFRSERNILSSYVAKVVSETAATDWSTPPAWGSNGQLPSIPVEHSLVDSHVLVIDLDKVSQFHRGEDSLSINGISLLPSLVQDPRFDTIIYKSEREKIVFSGGTFTGGGEISLIDPLAADYAQKISYYFPNATQITNYSDNRQAGTPPILPAAINGKNVGVDLFGEDLYKDINKFTYGSATIGSVLAPNATVVYSGGNMNGLLMVKDFHQRDGAELHNFRANWVDRDFELDPKGSLMLVKKSKGKNDELEILPHAKFIMYKVENDKEYYYGFDGSIGFEWYEGKESAYEFETDLDGEIFISGLPAGMYYMEEVKAPEGHEPLGETIEFVVTPENVTEEETVVEEVINQRTPLINVKGQKLWKDDENGYDTRPKEVVIELYRNNEKIDEQIISDETNWTYEFKDLPQFDSDKNFLNYTVKELAVPGYDTVISRDNQRITNTLNEKFSLDGKKIWDDVNNASNLRPDSIIVDLFQNNVRYPVESREVTEADGWAYAFNDLEKYDSNGKLIRYRIVEQSVAGYETIYDENGTDITNRLTPKINLNGEKIWKDNENAENTRPDKIIVGLYLNGELLKSIEVSSATDWKYEFNDLDQFDQDGELNDYTIKEITVPNYETAIDLETHDITNTLVGTTEVNGEKKWEDGENNGGIRPDSITVELLQNDKDFKTVEVKESDNWKYEFTDLPKYDESGKAFVYTIKEIEVPGYETIYAENGRDITNKLLLKIDINGQKIWKDDENAESTRPDKITVELYLNDKLVKNLEVTAVTDWKYEFSDLDQFDQEGNLNVYTIKEIKVPDYQTEITRDNQKIINTLVGTTEVKGEKKWEDGGNNAGIRPDSITIELLQNDKAFKTVEVKESDNWQYEFTDLPKYDESGKAFTYTIKEIEVPGYETIYAENGRDITNKLLPKIDINGQKIWKDDENAGSTRPDNITVELYLIDKLVKSLEVTAETDWKYEFSDLDQFDQEGNLNVYTIKEIKVPDYQTEISRDNQKIVNTLVGTTEVKGEKKWEDGGNNAGIRPDSITIELLQNDKAFKTVEVKESDNWKYEFTDLPKYDESGKAFVYTIKEIEVPGYETIYAENGRDITNKLLPKIDISGQKIWKDDENAESTRPEKITVELYLNDKLVKSLEVTATTDWKYEFKELDQFDQEGNLNVYTIKEIKVPDYQTEISRDNQKIINTLVGTTEVKGEKKWEDDNNSQGLRPISIVVELYQNNQLFDNLEVTGSSNWQFEFTDLPKFDEEGKLYKYTIREISIPDYETIYAEGTFDITNKLGTTETTSTTDSSSTTDTTSTTDSSSTTDTTSTTNSSSTTGTTSTTDSSSTTDTTSTTDSSSTTDTTSTTDSSSTTDTTSTTDSSSTTDTTSTTDSSSTTDTTSTTDSSSTTDTTSTTDSTSSQPKNSTDQSKKKDDLPQAGETANTVNYIIGLLLASSSLILLIKKESTRRKE